MVVPDKSAPQNSPPPPTTRPISRCYLSLRAHCFQRGLSDASCCLGVLLVRIKNVGRLEGKREASWEKSDEKRSPHVKLRLHVRTKSRLSGETFPPYYDSIEHAIRPSMYIYVYTSRGFAHYIGNWTFFSARRGNFLPMLLRSSGCFYCLINNFCYVPGLAAWL